MGWVDEWVEGPAQWALRLRSTISLPFFRSFLFLPVFPSPLFVLLKEDGDVARGAIVLRSSLARCVLRAWRERRGNFGDANTHGY